MEYLDLEIPKKLHTPNTCNFNTLAYRHIYHNTKENTLAYQLNLSENLHKTDKVIIDLLTTLTKSQTTNNQEYLKTQIETLRNRVEKNLNKADKFPNKKEIKELLILPEQLERQTQRILEELRKEIKEKIDQIQRQISEFKKTYIGE